MRYMVIHPVHISNVAKALDMPILSTRMAGIGALNGSTDSRRGLSNYTDCRTMNMSVLIYRH
jgi:hypothetical protein